ncbi:serine hydrolase [Deminuibacter soli]|uniref:beta-lactamase n=1 Tax=Deminuibacter soli TaxID=2291815 RepID=A0A3E1NEQ5_9BACT|nr:serine hydrolase [Deminuibacter soli]RFM26357.1 serine hydrolase [Deminuibacter soli]
MRTFSIIFLSFCSCMGFSQPKPSLDSVAAHIGQLLLQHKGNFAVAFKDPASGKTLFINEHALFHAASTMKTPVMMEVYQQAAAGLLSMNDAVPVHNHFKSIADSSVYTLDSADDSEHELYTKIGTNMRLYDLVYAMIIRSSNLATNIVIEKVGAPNVMRTMRHMGAQQIQVLRGVEDNKAFAAGLNNKVTAYDLMLLYEALANGRAVNAAASTDMIDILLHQEFNDIIPARLPAGVKVAHKTGNITGVHHDSGIVYLPDGRKYVLVLLSSGWDDEGDAIAAMAEVSRLLYSWMITS